ncbi:MAG: ABC transporter ATP-binding protein [Chitinophagaceae bacterium]
MYLKVENIVKAYGKRKVLQNASLQVPANTTVSILGKSGCGKSTLLKIIAGIEQQDSGNIYLNEENITTKKANRRNIVYLFQEALLFPHLTVFENIAFGLRIRKQSNDHIRMKVNSLLEQLEISGEALKLPDQLSGGQKQRVAFGRALIINPPLILLDEPFSSLDVETRATMQQLYKSIANSYSITALFVTHDLKECLIMGDSIAYMENGNLTVYDNRTAFINDLKTGVKGEINFWNTLN